MWEIDKEGTVVYKKKITERFLEDIVVYKNISTQNVLIKIDHDTTRKSEKHELIRVVSRTISCCISESPLQFISFLTVIPMCLGVLWRGVFVQLVAVAGPGLLSLLREVLRKLLWQYKDDICRGL